MVLYILGEYAMYIPYENLRDSAFFLTKNILSPDMLVIMAVATLPFSLSLCVEGGRKIRELRTFVLVIACAVLVDSFVFWCLALISLFVYVMFAYKAPAGALLGGALVLSPAFVIISELVSSASVSVDRKVMYDVALGRGDFEGTINYWMAFVDINGILPTVLFLMAMLLVIYRALGCMAINRNPKVSQSCGTVVASSVMMCVCSLLFNPFADLRVVAVMWFALGLCGSVYSIYTKAQYSVQEV